MLRTSQILEMSSFQTISITASQLTTRNPITRWFAPQALTGLLLEMRYEIYVYFGVALVWYLASIVCLVHSLRRAAGATERNQVKWILVGALLANAAGQALHATADRSRAGIRRVTHGLNADDLIITDPRSYGKKLFGQNLRVGGVPVEVKQGPKGTQAANITPL